ncbi:sugar transferase [Alloiococcus sp. CFN-8]|uniref:sugar transferase n=1 Tax=Alloiococcus sp. CFN-8 TaxID=3416081 RepID=UPI003CFA5C9F
MDKNLFMKRTVVTLMKFVFTAVQGIVFAFFWYGYYNNIMATPYFKRGNFALIGLYIVIFVVFGKLFGGYKVGVAKVQDIIYSMSLAVIATNLIAFLQLSLIQREFVPFTPLILMTVLGVLLSMAWAGVANSLYSYIYPPKKLLVVYGDRNPSDFIRKLKSRRDKYNISEMISINAGERRILAKAKDYEAVVLWDLPDEFRNKLVKYCFEQKIGCYLTPKVSDIILFGSENLHLFDTPLVYCDNKGIKPEQAMMKRIMDIVLSAIGIIAVSPFMLLAAAAIKLYDKGPVIYKQKRLTEGEKEFYIYKFRSMRVDSEKDGAILAKKNDSRITPVGNILRTLHIDELPQLFNILKGDMSLVGPRPERREIMDKYSQELPEFPYRLRMKAGLTGYAQVYGKYNTTPYDKLKLDLYYIEHYSLKLDIKIILLTLKIFFQKETSEGVESWQRDAAEKRDGKITPLNNIKGEQVTV